MRRDPPIVALVGAAALGLVVAACGFDSSGAGSSGAASLGDAGDGGAGSKGDDPDGGDDDDDDDDGDDDDDDVGGTGDGGSSGEGGDVTGIGSVTTPDGGDDDMGDGSTGAGADDDDDDDDDDMMDACDSPGFFKQVVAVGGAVVDDPMVEWTMPISGLEFACSEQTLQGSVTFGWEAPCHDQYFLWAHVYDDEAGAQISGDPDTFSVSATSGGTFPWTYGCHTVWGGAGWRWLQVQDTSAFCFDPNPMEYTFVEGPGAFTFANVESGSYNATDPPGSIAAISRILVTNDPAYVPTADD